MRAQIFPLDEFLRLPTITLVNLEEVSCIIIYNFFCVLGAKLRFRFGVVGAASSYPL